MLGLILVGAYTSDLGDANEAASGYFSGTLGTGIVGTYLLVTSIADSTPSRIQSRAHGRPLKIFKVLLYIFY